MNTSLKTSLVAAVLLSLGAGAGYGIATWRHSRDPAAPAGTSPGAAVPEGRKVLYWYDPMVPQHKFDQPGKSPFMDMQLVPVYADEQNDTGVKVSPGVQQNLGIRTATVARSQAASSFDAVGTAQFDERLPEELRGQLDVLERRLDDAAA